MISRTSSKRTPFLSHVVWAVDPLSDLNLQTQAVHAVESLETSPIKIEPVYVLPHRLMDFFPGFLRSDRRERRVKGRMRRLAKLVPSPGLKALRVLLIF